MWKKFSASSLQEPATVNAVPRRGVLVRLIGAAMMMVTTAAVEASDKTTEEVKPGAYPVVEATDED